MFPFPFLPSLLRIHNPSDGAHPCSNSQTAKIVSKHGKITSVSISTDLDYPDTLIDTAVASVESLLLDDTYGTLDRTLGTLEQYGDREEGLLVREVVEWLRRDM